jgi:hypothetical protein
MARRTHDDPIRRDGASQRCLLCNVVRTSTGFESSRRQSPRAHYPPPRNLGTVARHHGTHSSCTARAEYRCDVAVRHHAPRRNRANDFQYVLGELDRVSIAACGILAHDEVRPTDKSPDAASFMIIVSTEIPKNEKLLLDALPCRREMFRHIRFANTVGRERTRDGNRLAEHDRALVKMASDGDGEREIHC